MKYICIIILLFIIAGCQKKPTIIDNNSRSLLSPQASKLALAINKIGISIFKKVVKSNASENILAMALS
jgi:uncharacterized protein YcfL